MSAFKSLTSQDVIITPFIVNKSFTFEGDTSFIESDVFIERLKGTNIIGEFNENTELTTGTTSSEGYSSSYYQRDIYNSTKQLYYTNYISNPISSSYSITDMNGNILESDINTNVYSRFDNYLETTLSSSRYFPTASNISVGVVSIPSQLYGDHINPGTFRYEYPYSSVIASASYVDPDIQSGAEVTIHLFNIDSNPYNLLNNQGIFTSQDITEPVNMLLTGSAARQGGGFGATLTIELSSSVNGILDSTSNTYGFSPNAYSLSVNDYTLVDGEIIEIKSQASSGNFAIYASNLIISYSTSSLDRVVLTDDKEGYLIESSSQEPVGVISYSHGLVTITDKELLTNFYNTIDVTCSFQSSRTIYETQYKCTIRENEFNYSLNPSLISSSNFVNPLVSTSSLDIRGQVYDFVTGSSWTPYITTIGLYNENQELLAVAKLSQPLPTSRTTDMSVLINLDK